MDKINKIEIVKEFEHTINLAKARALSKVSLERPLTDQEFQEYKKVMGNL